MLALGLRCWRIEQAALDHDEVYEVVHRTTDLVELSTRPDRFPPLYRWLVSLTIEATDYEMSVRWFSAVVGALTVIPITLWASEIAGRRAGLVAGVLIAISGHHLMISQQARGYSLMVLLCSWMLYAAWRLRSRDNAADWALFLVSSWLAIATHYFSGVLLILLGAMLLIERRGSARRHAILAAIVLAVSGAPLIMCLRADLEEGDTFYHQPVVFDKENYAYGYLWLITGGTLGPSLTELRESVAEGRVSQALAEMAPWAIACFGCVVLLSIGAWRRLSMGDRWWFAVVLLAPPWVMLLFTPMIPTGYNFRYLVWLVAPLTVWLSLGATIDRRRIATTAATLGLVALAALATANRHFDERYHDDDFHGVVALIEREHTGDKTPAVLVASRYYGQGVRYTLPEDWAFGVVPVRPDLPNDWQTVLPDFADEARGRPSFWLVASWKPPSNRIRQKVDELVERLDAQLVARVGENVLVYLGSTESLQEAKTWAD